MTARFRVTLRGADGALGVEHADTLTVLARGEISDQSFAPIDDRLFANVRLASIGRALVEARWVLLVDAVSEVHTLLNADDISRIEVVL